MADNELLNNRFTVKQILYKVIPIVTVLVIAATLTIYLNSTKKEFKPPKPQELSWQITTTPALLGDYSPQQRLYAQLHTERLTRLVAPVSAEVVSVEVASGQFVESGQEVVRLDRQTLQNNMARIEARLQQQQLEQQQTRENIAEQQKLLKLDEQLLQLQQKNQQRIEQLAKQGNSSARDLESATEALLNRQIAVVNRNKTINDLKLNLQKLNANLPAVQADLDDAKRNIRDASLATPRAGLVLNVFVQQGSRINANGVVAEILPLGQVEFEALLINRQLPEVLQSLQDRQKITATIELFAERYQARLDRLKGVSNAAGQVGIFVVDSISVDILRRIRPNLTVPLTISLPQQQQSIAVPYAAIYGTDKVFLLKQGRLQSVLIELLGNVDVAQEQPWALIRSAQIQANDRIMTTHLPNAYTGMRVNAIEAGEP